MYNCIEEVNGDYLVGYDKLDNKIYTIDHKLKLEKAEEYFNFKYNGKYDSSVQAMNALDRLINS